MEIRKEKEIPKKRGTRKMQFPELLALKPGQVAAYPLDEIMSVRNACAFIRRTHNIRLVTRVDLDADEISVRVKTTKGGK